MNLKHTILRLLANLRQRTSRLFSLIIACLAPLLGLNPSANAQFLRVDGTNGTCAGDGSGWGGRDCYVPSIATFPTFLHVPKFLKDLS